MMVSFSPKSDPKGFQGGSETCCDGLEMVALTQRQEAELEMLRSSLGVSSMNESIRGELRVREEILKCQAEEQRKTTEEVPG